MLANECITMWPRSGRVAGAFSQAVRKSRISELQLDQRRRIVATSLSASAFVSLRAMKWSSPEVATGTLLREEGISRLITACKDVLADAEEILHRLVTQIVGPDCIEETFDELAKHGLALGIHERAIEEERSCVSDQLERMLAVVWIGASDVGQRQFGDRRQRHGLCLAIKVDREGGPLVRVVRESWRVLQQLAVSPPIFRDAHGVCANAGGLCGKWLEVLPQCCHDVLGVGCHDGIEELLRQVVDAQFERAETLTDKLGR